MNPRMTISIDSTLAALIKANERIKELEKVQAEYVTLVRKYEELILRHADLVKELSQRVRLDDPVVKGLVDALELVDASGRDHGSDPLTGEACGCESCENYFAIQKALSAYNARLKEVGCE